MSHRILLIDIETAPVMAAIWPPLHETNAVWVERGTYILCFAAMWLGENKVHTFTLPDYPSFKSNIHDDKLLCGHLHSFLNECTIAVAHNGDRFDQKLIRTRLLINGYSCPSPIKQVDTLKWARSVFKFDSAKLDSIGQALQLGRKIPNTGARLWRDCYHGDKDAFATMARYCAQDVRLLSRTYATLRPWAPGHIPTPNHDLQCTACQSSRLVRRGSAVTRKRHYRRLQCAECGHWQQGELIRESGAGSTRMKSNHLPPSAQAAPPKSKRTRNEAHRSASSVSTTRSARRRS